MQGASSNHAYCHGWIHDVTHGAGLSDDTHDPSSPTSSGFTAINRQPRKDVITDSTVSRSVQQNQARRRRRHNPTVAQYLGLGSDGEPAHLEKYAPLSSPVAELPTKPIRKLPKVTRANGSRTRGRNITCHESTLQVEQRSSDESFCIAQAPIATREVLVNHASILVDHQFVPDDATGFMPSFVQDYTIPVAPPRSICDSTRTISQGTVPASPPQESKYHEDDMETDITLHAAGKSRDQILDMTTKEFDDGLDDEDLLILMSETHDGRPEYTFDPMSSSPSTVNIEPDRAHCSYSDIGMSPATGKDAQSENGSRRFTKTFVSPVTATTRLPALPDIDDEASARKPIVRSPYPTSVCDRSPIIGLFPTTVLRTCFRVGEAINQNCHMAKTGRHVIIELYARILKAERTDTQQLFMFCDLFHAKPPYIKGVYEAAIWKSVALFEYDGRRLLQEGRMCRCIGTLTRIDKDWVMTVLNIWEATWEDVDWVEGIVNC
ncbi:hypothetical protein ACN47E_000658 [Coniothyrium glycines]